MAAVDEHPIRTALEREHRDIDGALEDFLAGRGSRGRTEAALTALRRHIYLEEEFLFPPLRDAGLMAPVFVMLREHGEIWRTMDALERRLGDGATAAEVRTECETLLAQLDRHNSKEEPIIYPEADTKLSEDARAELEDFIANEALPEGWTCQTV